MKRNQAINVRIKISFAGRCLIWAAQTSSWLMMPPDVDAVVDNIRKRHTWIKIGNGPWQRYGGNRADRRPR